jgi:hypothetical protein
VRKTGLDVEGLVVEVEDVGPEDDVEDDVAP